MNTPSDDNSHDQKIVSIYTLSDPYEAELIKNTLEDHDIRCSLDGETQGGFVGVVNIGILVKESDAERAVELIRKHHDHSEEHEDSKGSDEAGEQE
ncbi:MAG: DUF2007 domain-containing protein [Mariniblastus sp.]|nr:DUF2007 domain-containing protein [Mariniblastus sp.]